MSAGTKDAVDDGVSRAYHLEEYKSLRAEIDRWHAEVRFLERAGVIGPLIFYSWLYTTSDKDLALLPLWIAPIGAAYFMWERIRRIKHMIRVIADYTVSLEIAFRHPNVSGWEHHLGDHRKKPTYLGVGVTDKLFWRILIAFYTVVACVGIVRSWNGTMGIAV